MQNFIIHNLKIKSVIEILHFLNYNSIKLKFKYKKCKNIAKIKIKIKKIVDFI